MELSNDDIRRLEGAGYQRDKFSALDNHVIRLMNIGGWCYFYSPAERKCRVYRNRPMGCRLYPIVYSVEEGVIVDALCPMGHTVSEREVRIKRSALCNLLRKLDQERRCATPIY